MIRIVGIRANGQRHSGDLQGSHTARHGLQWRAISSSAWKVTDSRSPSILPELLPEALIGSAGVAFPSQGTGAVRLQSHQALADYICVNKNFRKGSAVHFCPENPALDGQFLSDFIERSIETSLAHLLLGLQAFSAGGHHENVC